MDDLIPHIYDKKMKKITLSLLFLILFFGISKPQGLVLNEFSNGPAGNQEYYEYVVVGPPSNPNCGPVDLRGWIIDDNNGDFSCGPRQGVGIAPGHVRFSMNINWSAVPTGSIILVYNDPETNPAITLANDPTDANADLVYIVPITSPLLERNSGGSVCPVSGTTLKPMGCDPACNGTGTSAYLPATYVASTTWTQISMANSDDAAQVRTPTGAYFHGVGYGGILMNGGPDNIFFAGAGTGDYYALTNGTSTNFRLQANWSTGTVVSGGETPAAGNSVNNTNWILSLRNPCVLPLTIVHQDAYHHNDGVKVEWVVNDLNGMLSIEKSVDLISFEKIYSKENNSSVFSGDIIDYDISESGFHYYRIRIEDQSGEMVVGETMEVYAQSNSDIVEYYDMLLTKKYCLQSELPKNQLLFIRRGSTFTKTIVTER